MYNRGCEPSGKKANRWTRRLVRPSVCKAERWDENLIADTDAVHAERIHPAQTFGVLEELAVGHFVVGIRRAMM